MSFVGQVLIALCNIGPVAGGDDTVELQERLALMVINSPCRHSPTSVLTRALCSARKLIFCMRKSRRRAKAPRQCSLSCRCVVLSTRPFSRLHWHWAAGGQRGQRGDARQAAATAAVADNARGGARAGKRGIDGAPATSFFISVPSQLKTMQTQLMHSKRENDRQARPCFGHCIANQAGGAHDDRPVRAA